MRLTRNKRGLELTINFLVMLVIGLVVFGFGLVFVFKLIDQGGQVVDDIDSRTKKNIENLLLSRGERVVVPFQTLRMDKGDSDIIPVGIFNVLEHSADAAAPIGPYTFHVRLSLVSYIPKGEKTARTITPQLGIAMSGSTATTLTSWPAVTNPIATWYTSESIAEQKTKIVRMPVSARTAAPGTYVVRVDVMALNANPPARGSAEVRYSSPHQIAVIVS